MGKEKKPNECEALRKAVHRLRTHGRKRIPRGYRKDRREYEETTLDER